MSKGADTRGKIIAAAAKLLRRSGYNGTALQEILDAGEAPRGSLYFHFPDGKEQIGEAALRLSGEAIRHAIATAAATSDSAETFVVRIARGMGADLEKSGFRDGCPIATTALESTPGSGALWTAARDIFRAWQDEIAQGLVRLGVSPAEAPMLAGVTLSLLEGALLLARTHRDLMPMRQAEQALRIIVA